MAVFGSRFHGIIALTGVLIGATAGMISADESARAPLRPFELAIQAEVQLVNARLEWERLNLKQLTRLYDNGHAAWLEWARQESVVQSLEWECESLNRFGRFLDSLSNRLIDESRLQEQFPESPPRKFEPQWSSSAGPVADLWDEQLRLRRNIELAERNLADVKRQLEIGVVRFPVDQKTSWDLAAGRLLQARADSRGGLAIANCHLRQCQLRRSMLLDLHARGLASAERVHMSRLQVESANARLLLEQHRIDESQRLFRAWQATAKYSDDDFAIESVDSRALAVCCWPDAVFEDTCLLVRLVDLRRQGFELDIKKHADMANEELQRALLQRLMESVSGDPESRLASEYADSIHELQLSLNRGEQCQLDAVRLKIEALQANALDANERIRIGLLEENRMIDHIPDRRPSNSGAIAVRTTLFQGIGSDLVAGTAADRIEHVVPNYFVLGFRHKKPAGSPLLQGTGGPARLTRAAAQRSATAVLQANRTPWRLNDGHAEAEVCVWRFGPWSSPAIYPFGIPPGT